MRKAPLLVLAAISLAGCAAAPRPEFTPTTASANVATVYIYRPPNQGSTLHPPEVYVGSEKLFALQSGGYGVVILPPGEYTFAVRNACTQTVTHEVAAHDGDEIFLRVRMPAPRRSSASQYESCRLSPTFEAIDKSVAPSELFYTKLAKGASREGSIPKSVGK